MHIAQQDQCSGNDAHRAQFFVLDAFQLYHLCTVRKRRLTIVRLSDHRPAKSAVKLDPQQQAGDCRRSTETPSQLIGCDVWHFHHIIRHVLDTPANRQRFVRFARATYSGSPPVWRLLPTRRELIDFDWNELNLRTAYTHIELDHLTSWLSTLGGGYSALGDSMDRCAEIAGRISVYQFRVALRFGDPPLVARSKLYMAIALIQKHRLRVAKHITRRVYREALAERDIDERLVKMCQGIWLKLQWAYTQRHYVRAA